MPESKKVLKTRIDVGISEGHRSKLKELSMAKARILSNKIFKIVVDYNSMYKINMHESILI